MQKPEISGHTITIPSDAIYLAAIDEFITDQLIQAGISGSIIADLAISVSEIVNNAIAHGNAGDINKKVAVRIKIKPDKVYIHIKDQGERK